MKSFLYAMGVLVIATPAFALTPAGTGRRAMSEQMNASRAITLSKNQINAMGDLNAAATIDKSSIREPVNVIGGGDATVMGSDDVANGGGTGGGNNSDADKNKDQREKERLACISNNIGIGNTFVWASRYSNVNNYSSMIEDVENPDNNVCFVKVELRSDDAKISVSDIPSQYYEMGREITCGEWADGGKIKSRILDAKKSGRTWGTVAGAVGGAGVGVGMMELFGNKAIGGKVQGQKNKKLNETELLRSLLLAQKGSDDYKNFMRYMRALRDDCENTTWSNGKPKECEEYDYNYFLNL